ncbi:hypothetical protein ABZZ16_00800, partial [Streptomyces sp. NPDC006386]|uniref:hypothetical protein n=1 Tax=Streptomyces sp. NPDC006386 TaxID=3156762 RepID=UPI0033BB1FB1
MDFTAFCLAFPEMNLSPVLAAGGQASHTDLCAVDDPGSTIDAQVLNDLGKSTQPDVRATVHP